MPIGLIVLFVLLFVLLLGYLMLVKWATNKKSSKNNISVTILIVLNVCLFFFVTVLFLAWPFIAKFFG